LEFREDIRSSYSVVFDAGGEEENGAIPSGSFADKWGWFGVMHRLCNQDISKLESITKINLLECFTWLSYEIDLNSQNKVNYGSK
jgi:hypothetical protein